MPARLLALALALALAAPAAAAAEPIRVIATIGPLADMAREVAGDCAAVTALVGPGNDPHTYRATPGDVAALNGADLILYLGLGLEGQLAQVLDRLGARRAVAGIGAALPADRLMVEDGGTDPHVWMAPALWAEAIAPVAAALTVAAPACAEGIAAGAARHAGELAALDAWGRASIVTIPEDRRTLVTAHDAFGYMARDWGLTVAAIQGISTEAEASVADISDTARLVADAGVPAVFVESTINPRTINALIDAARALGQDVSVGGSLYADAMGAEGTPEGTYVGMIRANVTAIATALGGAPAPWPAALAGWAAVWQAE
jgi:manganese/zinc/iron transport system substrate-binding protein